MKRSAKERRLAVQAAEREARAEKRAQRVRAVVARVDDDGYVSVGPDTRMTLEAFLEGAQQAALMSGAAVRVEGRDVVFEAETRGQIPNAAVGEAQPEAERSFEAHPFFSSRTTVSGFDAFHTRGPQEPQLSSFRPVVMCRAGLFVKLPEGAGPGPWYVRSSAVTFCADNPPAVVDRIWASHEASERDKAEKALAEALGR